MSPFGNGTAKLLPRSLDEFHLAHNRVFPLVRKKIGRAAARSTMSPAAGDRDPVQLTNSGHDP